MYNKYTSDLKCMMLQSHSRQHDMPLWFCLLKQRNLDTPILLEGVWIVAG